MRTSGLERLSVPGSSDHGHAAYSCRARRSAGGELGRIGALHGAPGIEWVAESPSVLVLFLIILFSFETFIITINE